MLKTRRTSKLLISAPFWCANLPAVNAAREWDCGGEEAISRSHGPEISGWGSGPLLLILAGTGLLTAASQPATLLDICLKKVSCGENAQLDPGIRGDSLMSTITRQGWEKITSQRVSIVAGRGGESLKKCEVMATEEREMACIYGRGIIEKIWVVEKNLAPGNQKFWYILKWKRIILSSE